MTGGWGRYITASSAIMVAATIAGRATGQNEPGGWQVTGTYGLSVEANDNPTLDPDSLGTDTIFDADFGLQVLNETTTSALRFDLGGTLRERTLDDEGLSTGLVNPFVTVGYDTEGANSILSFELTYRESDLDDRGLSEFDQDFIDNDFDDRDLVVSGGDLRTTSGVLGYEIGREGPFGAEIDYRYFDRRYSDDADPTLNDSTTQNVRLTASFRPSNTLTFRTFVAQRDYEEDDGDVTDRTTTDVGIGLDYDISPIWRFESDFAYQEVEEEGLFLGIPGERENDGFAYDVTLSREVPNGRYFVSVDQEISTFISQTTLMFGRELELPSGNLSFEIGATDPEFFDTELVGGVRWSYLVPRGQFDASYERSVVVNDENELRKRDFLRLSYLHEINTVSSLSVGFDYASSEQIGLFPEDPTTDADFTITYRRELNRDWDWSLTYRGRYSEESDGSDATSNAFIAGIDRTFSIRP